MAPSGQQVAVAQLLTYLFKRWNANPDALVKDKHADKGSALPMAVEIPRRDTAGS